MASVPSSKRTHALPLLVRYDRRAEIHEAFFALGCCVICRRRLKNTSL
jgi:hypothetical protein